MKWLAAVCFIPFFAHADLPQELIKYLEDREIITPADSYVKGDATFAENENIHRKIKFSFKRNSFSQVIKFPPLSSDEDKNFYGVVICDMVFREATPSTKGKGWDDSPDELKVKTFMESANYNGSKNYGEKKTKVNGWNLSVNLKPDQLWCTANK